MMKTLGIVLVALGLLGLLYGGVSWTYKDKIVDAGPIEITKNKTTRLPVTPLAAGVLLVVGAGLLVSRRA
jgi:uncharacterized membrane protein YidH (DUF202 family)